MEVLTVTGTVGGKAAPSPMSVSRESHTVSSTGLLEFGADTGVGGPFFADQMSAFLAHERCGVHLYRTVAGMTAIDEWREQYELFGDQTKDHVRILEELIVALGGDPMYVSPAARLTEIQNSKLLEAMLLSGALDTPTIELACLEAVLQAERKCHGNWTLVATLAEGLETSAGADAVKRAVAEVEDEEDEHVSWAEETWQQAVLAQLKPPM
jgi:rubrerythrin